jgi:SAM-dependent methyltransferase
MIGALKSRVPWPVKIAAKIALARLPVSYRTWSKLELFKHGFMANVDYARSVFSIHFDGGRLGRTPFTCLELGPGDSLMSAIVARLRGAEAVYLVDVGAYAHCDVRAYRAAAAAFSEEQPGRLHPADWTCVEDVLCDCHARYLTDGVASLRSLADGSINFIWSQAVLEHVRYDDFRTLMAELRRVCSPNGYASHQVDLRDHLAGALNNLRFARGLWEAPWFAASGFYTNRLRYVEICRICEEVGWNVAWTRCDRWPALPTPRARLHTDFREFTDSELCVSGFRLCTDLNCADV